MGKRRRRYISLLTVIVMLFSLMSGFPVRAEEFPVDEGPKAGGLILGWPEWNGDGQREMNTDVMVNEMWFETRSRGEFTIGWRHADGTVTPFTDEDLAYITITDENDQEVDANIQPIMEGYDDEETHEWIEERVGDGFYQALFPKSGDLKMTYSGSLKNEEFPQNQDVFTEATIHVEKPIMAVYSSASTDEQYLLGNQVSYGTSGTFYLIAENRYGENYKTEIEIAEVNFFDERVRDSAEVEKVENVENCSVYKITVPKEIDYPFNFQAVMDMVDYDYNGETYEENGTRREDRWFDCYPPERYGLLVDWTAWEDDGPVFYPDRLTGSLYDYEIKADNSFTFGWKDADGKITPIADEDMSKFEVYDDKGQKVTYPCIWKTTRWNDEKQEDESIGEGSFNLKFDTPGVYTVKFNSGEAFGNIPDDGYFSDSVKIYAVMPHVSLYSSEEISLETLIGPRAEYTAEQREFYINSQDNIDGTIKRQYTLDGFQLEGSSDVGDHVLVELLESGNYKITVDDGYTDHFNIRAYIKVEEYSLNESEWEKINEWEYDYWIDFDFWEPTPFGLGVAWPEPHEEDLPTFPEEVFHWLGIDAKNSLTMAFGWEDADGTVTPLALTDISKLHLYDPEGKEVKVDWIGLPTRWDEQSQEEIPLDIEGLFEVRFPGTGYYTITLDKDVSGIEVPDGMAVNTSVIFDVTYPTVGIYDSTTVSDESLIDRHSVQFTDDSNKVFYILATDQVDSWNKMERSITGYDVEMPYGFEDQEAEAVTITKVSDQVLKVVIADDCRMGFDVIVKTTAKNQHYNQQTQTWEYEDQVWNEDERMNFWYFEKERYGFTIGYPNPYTLMADEDMRDHLDGVFANSGISVIFAWRDSSGQLVQIIDPEEIEDLVITYEDGSEAPAVYMERQDNDGNIYDVWFDRPGLYTIKYTGAQAVDEKLEDRRFSDEVTVWVDFPFAAAYTSEDVSMETLIGQDVVYTPDAMEFYINGMAIADEGGSMTSTVNGVSVEKVDEPDFVEFANTDSGVKVTITKEPDKEFDGVFTLLTDVTIKAIHLDEQGQKIGEDTLNTTVKIHFEPGEGFAKGSIKVNLVAEGATPKNVKIALANLDDESYYGLDGTVIDNEDKIWIAIKPGTPVVFENLPVGGYLVFEDEDSVAVSGYDLVEAKSILATDEVVVAEDEETEVTLKNIYKAKKVVYPYKNEWVKGVWYNKDGTQTYKYKGSWKSNSKGTWFADTSGWCAKNCWQRIDGKDYYFGKNGYMESECYRDGYYLTKTGAYDGKGKAKWKKDSKGYWYQLPDGAYLKKCWAMIDGKWYYFKANGYAAKNEWVKGYYWIGKDMVWSYKPKGSWHQDKNGWWFGDTSGWYAKNETLVIDGKSYKFNAKGYWK